MSRLRTTICTSISRDIPRAPRGRQAPCRHVALDLGQYMSRVGLLRVSESAGPPSGLAAVRRHGHHQHPFGVGVCRHHQLHSAFAPAGLFSCPIGHQGSLPALRRSACPGSVALAAAPSAVNTKLQWKSRLQPHAGSELQRPSPLHMHRKTCPEPLRGPSAATRRQRRRGTGVA